MLLFFSVARSAHTSQAERANEANSGATTVNGHAIEVHTDNGEKMPTDKLLDISPQALRMSSPFNAEYWTAS
ncbi:hypothetical protein BLL52_1472 [Rhodoferax antarcticus ANT.BR]|uniref:Uncharacterized protein n=1 Tax=Rhodoferax antarcticus ANT.BR TaxID=1111071 RepID=A0A1Q8YGR7_9BURK|nr:hypothetical protein RA876_01840 [Rhodoferax antarcticus]OLP07185.1 hypothetical protein BLL52_1472 [Rhodoferax antarcticus ANT.BR]